MKGITGTVLSVWENLVKLKPDNKEIKFDIEIERQDLEKFFHTGQHIRVMDGKYAGEWGIITQIEDHLVTFFSNIR